MAENDEKVIIDRNRQLIIKTISRVYPLMLQGGELPSTVSRWIDDYASLPRNFDVEKVEELVLYLEDFYRYEYSKSAHHVPASTSPPDIPGMREIINDRDLSARRRAVELGKRVLDMTEEEEAIWIEHEDRRRREKMESDLFYNSQPHRIANPTPNKQQVSVNSQTSEIRWFLSLSEEERNDYAQWCAKSGVLRIEKNWSLYVNAMNRQYPEWEDLTTAEEADEGEIPAMHHDIDYMRDKLATSGWSEQEIAILDAKQVDSEYLDEISRETLNQPHFDGQQHLYTHIKVRHAQGRFRAMVLRNWGEACAVTGQKLVLDACHIIAHADGGEASIENGIALATDLHRLMDKGHMQLVDDRIVMSDEARREPRYEKLHGQALRVPNVPVKFR